MVTSMDHKLVYLMHQPLHAGFQLVEPPLRVLVRAQSGINPRLQGAVVTMVDVLDRRILETLRETALDVAVVTVGMAVRTRCRRSTTSFLGFEVVDQRSYLVLEPDKTGYHGLHASLDVLDVGFVLQGDVAIAAVFFAAHQSEI